MELSFLGRTLIIFGAVLVILGIILSFAPKIPFLGKLPGDIRIEKVGFRFYFPIVTCIVISIILSLILSIIFWIINRH